MLYPQEVIDEVRLANDIVGLVSSYVPSLKQKGNTFFGLCPFHSEKSASFSVSPDKQFFYCFGCGAAGNAISFIMKVENYDFTDTIRFLADRVHYQLPDRSMSQEAKQNATIKEQIFEMNKLAARFYFDELASDKNSLANEYLDKRKISSKTRVRFGLGFASKKRDALYKYLQEKGYSTEVILKSGLAVPSKREGFGYHDRFIDRLMFPIVNAQGKIVGFGGRILENGEPKYLNSPETLAFEKSKNLYGINFARLAKTKNLIIVEGYMDVISLHQAGFENAVAALGTAFNSEHVNLLKKYADSVTLIFDSDSAGVSATLRAIAALAPSGIKTKVLNIKEAKDPDEYIKLYGSENFGNLLQTAVSHITFQVDCIRKKFDLSLIDGRVQFTQEVAKILKTLDSAVEREVYTKEVSLLTQISQKAIEEETSKLIDKPLVDIKTVKRENINIIKKDKLVQKGIIQLQKELISLVAQDVRIYRSIKEHIKPEDLPDHTYSRLLAYIYSLHEASKHWYAADAINLFTEQEDLQKAAEIFIDVRGFSEGMSDKEKVHEASDIVRKIILYNIDKQALGNTDSEKLLELMALRRKINNLNINLIENAPK